MGHGADLARRRTAATRALVLVAALALLGGVARAKGPEFDATIATVNGDLIMKSDVLWNLALDPTVAPAEFWDPKVQGMMLRTLVDQRLLLQEAAKLPATQATAAEVQQEIGKLAGDFNTPDDQTRFEARLRLVGLEMPRLERIIRDRLQISKFVDFRFRSFVVVTDPEIRAYFDAQVEPKLPDRTPAALDAALAAERSKIEQVLVEEKINTAIDAYLEDARARAEVVRLDEPGAAGGVQAGAGTR